MDGGERVRPRARGGRPLGGGERDQALELWLNMDGVIAALVDKKKASPKARRKSKRPSATQATVFQAGGTVLPPI